jgi:hypothetical protein
MRVQATLEHLDDLEDIYFCGETITKSAGGPERRAVMQMDRSTHTNGRRTLSNPKSILESSLLPKRHRSLWIAISFMSL